ncbi:MAG: hypothetical protein IJA95_07410 [Bacteroidaceae bacterium]|nr:hypothetical protein [Bacteroidaceae bacterium]
MVRKRPHHVLTKRISQISWILEKGFLNLRSKMGNWSKQQKEEEEKKERGKVRKEKLSEYFFSLSNTAFGSLVIGVILLMLSDNAGSDDKLAWVTLLAGLVILIVMARVGNNILK